MNKWLLVGYGNPDRQDDGVAWHILCAIAVRFGLPAPETYDDDFPENDKLDFLFCLQLTPELAEDIAGYERVCFVDAHTENIPTPVQRIEVESEFQRSPFTHHLTPQSLVSMCENLYGKKPASALVSVRGYSFGFTRELSDKTAALVSQASQLAIDWLSQT